MTTSMVFSVVPLFECLMDIFDFQLFNFCQFFSTNSLDRMFVLQLSSFKITVWVPASIPASNIRGHGGGSELDFYVFDPSGVLVFEGSISLDRPHAQNLH